MPIPLPNPCERANWSRTDACFAPVRDQLAGLPDEWMIQSNDPLLDEPIPQPSGTRLLHEPNCQSETKIPLDL